MWISTILLLVYLTFSLAEAREGQNSELSDPETAPFDPEPHLQSKSGNFPGGEEIPKAIDFGLIDKGDGGVGGFENESKNTENDVKIGPELETEIQPEQGHNLGSSFLPFLSAFNPDSSFEDNDWDSLDNEDEYAFSAQTLSVKKVPKNEKASTDVFYFQPGNISNYSPGEVIRMREVLLDEYPANVKHVFQFMVRSTDSLDKPVGIVSSIYAPSDGDGKNLLSFQVPTDSPCIDCAPSIDMLDSMGKLERPLAYGWSVVVPDFQGLKAAFGAARLAGQATLDSVRGALKTGQITGISTEAQVALWGYSGGSIATGWAASLQPQYAPELGSQLVAAAVGGWITNYDTTIKAADGKLAAGLVGLALSGLAQQYPELVPIYTKYIRDSRKLRAILEGTRQMCLTSGVLRFLGVRFFKGRSSYFKGGTTVLDDPTVRKIIDDNTVALRREAGMPECPLFLHHALKDNIAPIEDTRRAVGNFCAWGIRSFQVNYVEETGHMSESRDGVQAVVTWLKQRFEGRDPVKGCVTSTFYSLKEDSFFDGLFGD